MSFPLPFEQIRWRSRRCAVSDFRVVSLKQAEVTGEIALHDIASIVVEPSIFERLTSIGTIHVSSARPGDRGLRLPRMARARQTALRLNLLVADLRGMPPDDNIAGLPFPSIWRVPPAIRLHTILAAPAVLLLTLVVIVIGLSGHEVRVAFGPDDPVRPNGVKRGRAEINAFMEHEVMPWAEAALGPVVGAGRVRCQTCHGNDADERDWRMPAVRALPEPAVRALARGSDSDMRNALHGYLAEEDNQAVAAHMRAVVTPGMAGLLRRPSYDFAQTYEFNRERAAFGCYHCHMVED